MHLFYVPDSCAREHVLPEDESLHAGRVLRLKKGDTLHLTDGKGTIHRCIITDDNPKHCRVAIDLSEYHEKYPPVHLHIAIAPTKSIDRTEWFLEKATEIGISEITPLITAHSERTRIKTERLNKVIVAAMKQSLKSWLPLLNEPADFNNMIHLPFQGQKFIAWCDAIKKENLSTLYKKGTDVLILVGPEGDFTEEEVNEAIKAGFVPVSLGQSRLRTETAGMVACHAVMINYQ